MKIRLSYFSSCPFSRAVILILDELKIEYEMNEINDFKIIISKYHKANNFYPILEDFSSNNIENEKTYKKISSFLAINEYLNYKFNKNEENSLYGKNINDKIQISESIWWMMHDIYQNCFSVIIYEKYLKAFEFELYDKSPNSFNVRMCELKLKEILMTCELKIKEQNFIATDFLTYSDFLLSSFISILDYMNLIDWGLNLINLKKWYLIIKSRPNFKKILKLRIAGMRPNQKYFLIDF
jgi:glutathione S-transferase